MSKKEKIKTLFEKKFDFSSNYEEIPENIFSSSKWSISSLQTLKEELNSVKKLLSEFELKEWSRHTKSRELSNTIKGYLRRKVKPEVLTQAWCKFYECVMNYPLIPEDSIISKKLTSLHLCEAPGAFISSLNHYIANNFTKDFSWEWYASTLNPDYEGNDLPTMIMDDLLIKYTYDHWMFGQDFTGDITKYYNHVDLVKTMLQKNEVSLVTADGSIDCQFNPAEQEKILEFLQYCEAITALAILRKGGTFLLKIFTIFEESTVCLLYLLTLVFEKVSVFKPISSKAGNSEVYIISIGYKGKEILNKIWDKLIRPYKLEQYDPNYSMFNLKDINRVFIEEVINCANFFKTKQAEVISNNVSCFCNLSHVELNSTRQRQTAIANQFLVMYNVKPIPPNRKLVQQVTIKQKIRPTVKKFIFNSSVLKFNSSDILPCDLDLVHVDIKVGKIIEELKSSQFCDCTLLSNYRGFGNFKVSPSLYKQIYNNLAKNLIIIDSYDKNFNNYFELQRNVFYTILNSKLNNFLIVQIPCLTHFLAGLFFILIGSFNEIYLHKSGFILLCNPIKNKQILLKTILKCIDDNIKNLPYHDSFSYDICHVMSTELLYNNEFHEFLINYNNNILI